MSLKKQVLDRYPNPPIEQQKLLPLHTSFLQNYAFLAPEQKRLDSVHPVDAKADVYAFGVLAYFLLMNELPEGVFDMPSSRKKYSYRWDELITHCLHNNPAKRPEHLTSALEAVRYKAAAAEEKKSEGIFEEVPAIAEEASHEEFVQKYAVPEIRSPLLVMPSEAGASSGAEIKPSFCFETAKPVETILHTKPIDAFQGLKPNLQMPQLERPRTDLDPGAVFHVNTTVKTYNPEPKDVTNVKPLLTDMVVIAGGTKFRGSHDGNRDEMPRHQITLQSFAIDIHPVTNEQFVRFLEVMGGEKDSNHNDIIRLRDSRIKRSGGKLSIESGYSKHPVVGVTWYGAVAYAKWVGKRLPTEAEWEIAARGELENSLYPTGDDIEKTQANFFSSDTTAVMSYASNGFGLYDMAGNVYEWCHDWYGYNYYEISDSGAG